MLREWKKVVMVEVLEWDNRRGYKDDVREMKRTVTRSCSEE